MRLRSITYMLAMLLGTSATASAAELKDRTFSTENAGKVVFSHSLHLKKKSPKADNISCKACHNSNMKDRTRYTMADMENGKSCGICHNGRKAFALAECSRCHSVPTITYNTNETGPTVFSHSRHLKTMECKSCHNKIFNMGQNKKVGMSGMEKGNSCGACHNGKKGFALDNCTRCHSVKDKNYRIAGAGRVTFSHQKHLKDFGCKDCHPALYRHGAKRTAAAMAEMKTGKSCGACHDSKIAFTVQANCGKCHKV